MISNRAENGRRTSTTTKTLQTKKKRTKRTDATTGSDHFVVQIEKDVKRKRMRTKKNHKSLCVEWTERGYLILLHEETQTFAIYT